MAADKQSNALYREVKGQGRTSGFRGRVNGSHVGSMGHQHGCSLSMTHEVSDAEEASSSLADKMVAMFLFCSQKLHIYHPTYLPRYLLYDLITKIRTRGGTQADMRRFVERKEQLRADGDCLCSWILNNLKTCQDSSRIHSTESLQKQELSVSSERSLPPAGHFRHCRL